MLLKYQENRKKVLIPKEKAMSDMQFLESSFRALFKFQDQVNLVISFQRFDQTFNEFVDLEEDEELHDLEKLNVVVTPVLVTPPAVSWRSAQGVTYFLVFTVTSLVERSM